MNSSFASSWPPYRSFRRQHRPQIIWPNNARIAFWVAPNIEFYEIDPPINPVRASWPRPLPDFLNSSWRDYGNRVGVWRCLEVFDRHQIVSSVSLNSAMCLHLPEVVSAFADRGWELFSHGIYNTRYLLGLDAEKEFAIINESCRQIETFWKQGVQGFLAPALTYSESTLHNLARAGLAYTLDLFHEDEPVPLAPGFGRLISIPYQVELNDFHNLVQGGLSASAYIQKFKDQFDQLYEEGAISGKVVSIPLHPYVIGMPEYIWALDEILSYVRSHEHIWFASARAIAAHYMENFYDKALVTVLGSEA